MNQFQDKVKKLLELTGLEDPVVMFDPENRKIEMFVNEGEWFKQILPRTVSDCDHVVKLLARKEKLPDYYVDINNYRKERERLIGTLANVAAKRASTKKELVRLPAMNAYERRLVHVELAIHPDVRTESEGEGRDRCVVVKPIVN